MNEIDRLPYFLILLGLVWIGIEVYLIKWMEEKKPKPDLLNKYPIKIRLLFSLPFGASWKKKVANEDVVVLNIYQKRVRIWYLSVLIPFVLFFILVYFYFF